MKLTIYHPNPKLLIELAQRLAEAYRPCVVLLEPTKDDHPDPAQSEPRAATAVTEALQCPGSQSNVEEIR